MALGFAMRGMRAIHFQPGVPLLTAGGSEEPSWTLCLFRDGKDLAGATPVRPAQRITTVPVPPTGMTT